MHSTQCEGIPCRSRLAVVASPGAGHSPAQRSSHRGAAEDG